ncbi:hypothetical protein V8G54_014148, partial [Vigna mungo]
TVAAATTNAKFQRISKTTTGFEYAQSLCLSSNCSAAASRTTIDGSRISRRPLACRRKRAASRRLGRRRRRRPELESSEEAPRNGVGSAPSSEEWLGDLVVAM